LSAVWSTVGSNPTPSAELNVLDSRSRFDQRLAMSPALRRHELTVARIVRYSTVWTGPMPEILTACRPR
jgi:hypothetical protein